MWRSSACFKANCTLIQFENWQQMSQSQINWRQQRCHLHLWSKEFLPAESVWWGIETRFSFYNVIFSWSSLCRFANWFRTVRKSVFSRGSSWSNNFDARLYSRIQRLSWFPWHGLASYIEPVHGVHSTRRKNTPKLIVVLMWSPVTLISNCSRSSRKGNKKLFRCWNEITRLYF